MTKTVINSEFSLDKSFQEILYKIDDWINEGSGWVGESINGEYVNISMYSPLIGSSFIELPNELKNPKKGMINIKSNDNKCFLWCHVRHLNLLKKHPERINKTKDWLIISIIKELSFLFQRTITVRLKNRIIFVLTCFVTKTELFIHFTYLAKNLVIAWICC